jgi:hypothetical protein
MNPPLEVQSLALDAPNLPGFQFMTDRTGKDLHIDLYTFAAVP